MENLNLVGKSKHTSDDAMKGLSAVFVDADRVYIDNGAIHAKSQLEKGLQFVRNVDELSDPKTVWVFWITLKRNEDKEQRYHGAMPFKILIDETAQKGYKSLAEQVNQMDKAVKGHVDLTGVPGDVKARLKDFLKGVRTELWTLASEEFLKAFDD
jgi:hypothetical protein